jgi:hypothetical protein
VKKTPKTAAILAGFAPSRRLSSNASATRCASFSSWSSVPRGTTIRARP